MTRNSTVYALLLILAGLLSHPMANAFQRFAQHLAEVLK